MFWYAPVMLLAILGWRSALLHQSRLVKDVALISLAGSVLQLLAVASFAGWHGSASFGPRYLVPALPFLVLPMALGIGRAPIWLWLPLAAISVAVNWLGAQFGFAVNVAQHFLTFARTGFELPAVGAVLSHSDPSSAIHHLFASAQWLILALYFGIVAGMAMVLIRLGQWHASGPVRIGPAAANPGAS